MRNFIIWAVTSALSLLLAIPVSAEPTLNGPTGLIVNPTADITELDHAWIALNFYDNDDNSVWTTNITGTISENIEVGAGLKMPEEGSDGILAFIKWLVYNETESTPGVAVGVTFSDVADNSNTQLYGVASKFFYFGDNASENASVHGGLSFINGENDDTLEFFAGLDIELAEGLIAIAEYTSDEQSIYNGFTYGARYYFGPQLTGQAGIIDGDLTLGASFIF